MRDRRLRTACWAWTRHARRGFANAHLRRHARRYDSLRRSPRDQWSERRLRHLGLLDLRNRPCRWRRCRSLRRRSGRRRVNRGCDDACGHTRGNGCDNRKWRQCDLGLGRLRIGRRRSLGRRCRIGRRSRRELRELVMDARVRRRRAGLRGGLHRRGPRVRNRWGRVRYGHRNCLGNRLARHRDDLRALHRLR